MVPARPSPVICFQCRRSDCRCRDAVVEPPLTVARALAWLGGACAAGSLIGALAALICR
jgi:hypothetical protein